MSTLCEPVLCRAGQWTNEIQTVWNQSNFSSAADASRTFLLYSYLASQVGINFMKLIYNADPRFNQTAQWPENSTKCQRIARHPAHSLSSETMRSHPGEPLWLSAVSPQAAPEPLPFNKVIWKCTEMASKSNLCRIKTNLLFKQLKTWQSVYLFLWSLYSLWKASGIPYITEHAVILKNPEAPLLT